MKAKEVAIGMKVAVNAADDGCIYTVEAIQGFTAALSYTDSGKKHNVGSIDVGSLRRPTEAQIRNAA